MAESILFSTADKILGALASLAVQEVCLVWGLESDLKRLKTTLSSIKSVILDAEDQQTTNHRIAFWLKQLKHVLYDAEDVLDDFAYRVLRKKVVNTYGGFNRKVHHFFSTSNPIAYRLRIGHQIKDLRLRLDEIATDKVQFDLVDRIDFGHVQVRDREMTHSFIHSSDIIGRDGDMEAIVALLMDSDHQGHPGDDNISVITIVGIGGLGKTALAKMVFSNPKIAKKFDKKIWLCLGDIKEFDVNQVIAKIGEEMGSDASNPQHSHKLIHDNLQDKSLLLVLDDAWDVNRDKWMELKSFLANGRQNKVMVTTRIGAVASCVTTTSPYILQGLPHGECVSLFKKLAFASEAEVDENLMKIGEDIVKKCAGNPLALRSLGSLLFSKSDDNEWLSVRDSSIWKIEDSQNNILRVLKFSYDRLPSYLKQCFVYCSIFPQDYKFQSQYLTSFWMAHGLLQSSKENRKPEDVGAQYINELLSRGFFQDCKKHITSWSFSMHDLVHDLACSLGQEEFAVVSDSDSNKDMEENVRHVRFERRDLTVNSSNVIKSVLASSSNVLTMDFFYKFKYVRFLCLDHLSFEELPNSIGTLKHLRALDLSYCERLKNLPNSICKLHNLQTLNLMGCLSLFELPKNIEEMIHLRYLWITTNLECSLSNNGIERLSSLQLLAFSECGNLQSLFEKTEENRMSTLRVLIVRNCRRLVSLFFPPGSINYSFTALEILCIDSCRILDLNDQEHLSQCLHLPRLKSLTLRFLTKLEGLPEWIHGCATTLQFLEIYGCSNLKALPEWLPDLACLRTLHIYLCPKLLCLPRGMERLITLKELKIVGRHQFMQRYKKEIGEDWPMIAHVPNIVMTII